jgi:hypothetical protein
MVMVPSRPEPLEVPDLPPHPEIKRRTIKGKMRIFRILLVVFVVFEEGRLLPRQK